MNINSSEKLLFSYWIRVFDSVVHPSVELLFHQCRGEEVSSLTQFYQQTLDFFFQDCILLEKSFNEIGRDLVSLDHILSNQRMENLATLARIQQINFEVFEAPSLPALSFRSALYIEAILYHFLLSQLIYLEKNTTFPLRISWNESGHLRCSLSAYLQTPDTPVDLLSDFSAKWEPVYFLDTNLWLFRQLIDKVEPWISVEIVEEGKGRYSILFKNTLTFSQNPAYQNSSKSLLGDLYILKKASPIIRILVLSEDPFWRIYLKSLWGVPHVELTFVAIYNQFMDKLRLENYDIGVLFDGSTVDLQEDVDFFSFLSQQKVAGVYWCYQDESKCWAMLQKIFCLTDKMIVSKVHVIHPQERVQWAQEIRNFCLDYIHSFEMDETLNLNQQDWNQLVTSSSSPPKILPNTTESQLISTQTRLLDLLKEERIHLQVESVKDIKNLLLKMETFIKELQPIVDGENFSMIVSVIEDYKDLFSQCAFPELSSILDAMGEAAVQRKIELCTDYLFLITYQYQCLKNRMYQQKEVSSSICGGGNRGKSNDF